MITTIDQAGRVVIPKVFRQKFHLNRRTEIEIVEDVNGLRLRLPQQENRFAEKDGVLVQCADTTCDVDATEIIRRLRENRSLEAGKPGSLL